MLSLLIVDESYPSHRDSSPDPAGAARLRVHRWDPTCGVHVVESSAGVHPVAHPGPAEYIRLLYEGGATEPTPVLVETTDGTFQEHMMGPLGYYKGKGLSVKGPTPRFRAAVDRTARYIDTEVTLLACEDRTGSAMYNPDGSKFHDGELHVYQMLLARRDGRLKIFTYSTQEVSACPLG